MRVPGFQQEWSGSEKKNREKELSPNVDLFKLLRQLNNTRKPTETSL